MIPLTSFCIYSFIFISLSGHGTHCAGTIGAIGNNEIGVTSVNPDPTKFQFFIGKGLSNSGSGSNANVVKAVEACVNAGAKVISMSLGGSGYSSTTDAFYKDQYDKGGELVFTVVHPSSLSHLTNTTNLSLSFFQSSWLLQQVTVDTIRGVTLLDTLPWCQLGVSCRHDPSVTFPLGMNKWRSQDLDTLSYPPTRIMATRLCQELRW